MSAKFKIIFFNRWNFYSSARIKLLGCNRLVWIIRCWRRHLCEAEVLSVSFG